MTVPEKRMDKLKRTWVEIDLDNLRYNCEQIKGMLNGRALFMAVVKADAYGHGDVAVANELQDLADWFAVSNIMEARRLRRNGIVKPILILGYTPAECCGELFELDITQTILGMEYAEKLSEAAIAAGVKVKVHIGVDTGMSRIGFSAVDTATCVNEIVKTVCLPGLESTGIFTHFAVSDEDNDISNTFTQMQHERFTDVVWQLEQRGVRFSFVHCCNSAAVLSFPSYYHTMVRPGIVMYGCTPSGKDMEGIKLRPVMTFRTVVSLVKDLPAGETIGYGRKFRAGAPMKVATVAAGYADGYPRCLANKGYGFVNECVVPEVGSVCMDQMMFDVSYADVKEGDVMTLFGGDSPITVDNVAAMAGTISYEILCGISRRVERVYLKGGKEISVVDYTD